MTSDSHHLNQTIKADSTHQTRELIKQRRYFEAKAVLSQALREMPGNIDTCGELAQVHLLLGMPELALKLLQACINQGVNTSTIHGLYWRARVRAAASSREAVQQVQEAFACGIQLPNYVVKEWQMIANGFLQAGWSEEAESWLQALGASGEIFWMVHPFPVQRLHCGLRACA